MKVEVTLHFRRAFIDLADQKDWDVPDIVMGFVHWHNHRLTPYQS